jgi:hypothetical protein
MRVRTHTNFSDPHYTESIPFQPFDATLRDVLRQHYISSVARWLLGRHDTSVLAMEGNSAWETALTISNLLDTCDILREARECPDLVRQIEGKVIGATRWLLEKKTAHDDQTFCWEHVTWDTSVILNALLEVLHRYRTRFSPDEQAEIEGAIIGATAWLYRQFEQWESRVKYPFGPADVAQIANTVLQMQRQFPNLLERVERQLGSTRWYDLPLRVIQYLLHRRTFRKFMVTDDAGSIEAMGCWWDDFFSTAETVEALARFHAAALDGSQPQWLGSITEVKTCLIECCAFLESTQLDGMWGNHIDTVRILRAYVMIRRLIPQTAEGRASDALIQPEIHITFKALRWICDEKQIFDDGSFLHALFLSVFYAGTLIEVYRSWAPCEYSIDKLYDDVVWASPMRTTPERTMRLAADISNDNLRNELSLLQTRLSVSQEVADEVNIARTRLTLSFGVIISVVVGSLLLAVSQNTVDLQFSVKQASDFLTLLALTGSTAAVTIGLIWKAKLPKARRRDNQ